MTGRVTTKNGKWYAILNQKDENGKPKPKWIGLNISAPGNKRKAEQLLREMLTDYEAKHITVNRKDTPFCDFINIWLEETKNRIEQITFEGYQLYISKHIYPYFKKLGVNLIDLEYQHIKDYYDLKSKELSVNSLRRHHAVINQTLRKAVQDGLIASNPAAEIKFSKAEKFTGKFLTVEQGNALLDASKNTPIEPAVILAMMYGLRRSELAGLKWDAVDFDNNTLSIRHTVTIYKTTVAKDRTKNKTSCRILPLNQTVKDYLLKLRSQQSEDKRILGSAYQDTEYICRWPDGRAVRCDYYTKKFKKFLIKNGLPEIRLHDLRHTCASFMLRMGCSMKEIQEWLGHSNIQTTMDVYAHLDYDAKKDVANRLGTIFRKSS